MNWSAEKALSGQGLSVLNEGIGLILSRWTALKAAVENEWGGRNSRQKAEQAVSDIFTWFTQSKEPSIALESILSDTLMDLNTIAEDGSIDEVAGKLISLHEECLEGNYESVEKLRASNSQMATRANIVKVSNGSDDDDDEDSDGEGENDCAGNGRKTNMMVDEPEQLSHLDMRVDELVPKPVAQDEDGWMTVPTRRNKGRKN